MNRVIRAELNRTGALSDLNFRFTIERSLLGQIECHVIDVRLQPSPRWSRERA